MVIMLVLKVVDIRLW